ncbi:MAG: hypothetical protein JW861_04120 [Bacteroidales bacterium]|nr:hypothetical protein [Bacteroidales bacterium]
MISRSYGFAGIEPNTVMMAWERQSLDPVRFAQTVKTLTGLDLNVILMDYDKRAGYGQKQRIDIWWRGQSNNGNLALSLMKFLWLSERWRKAQLRLLIVNPVNDYRESILQNASQILDNLRMRAEVRVINNQYEQRSFYEIVQQESVETDLTFLGLPDIEPGKEQPFVDEFNFLCQNIGTVILIRASSLFKELKIGGSTDSKKGMRRMERSLPEILRHEETRSREISFPGDPELDLPVRELYHSLLREYDLLYHNHLMVMGNSALETIRSIRAAAAEAFSRISSRAGKSGQSNNFIFRSQMEFLRESGRFLEQYVKDVTETQRDLLRNALLGYAEAMEAIASGLPRDISKVLDNNQIARRDGDGFALSLFKLRKRILKRFIRRSPVYRIRFRKLAGGYFPRISMEGLYDALQEFGMMGLYQSSGIRKFVYLADRLFQAMDSRQGAGDKDGPEHEIDWSQLDQQVAHLEKQVEESMKQLHLRMITYLNSAVRSLILDLQYPCSNRRIRKRDREGGGIIEYERILGQISEQWAANQEVLFNFPLLQVHLLVFGVQMRRISSDSHNRISRRIGQDILEVQKRFRDYLESYLAEGGKERGFRFDIPQTWRDDVRLLSGSVSEEFNRRIRQLFVKIPDQILLFPESSLDNYAVTQFSGLPTVSLSVSGYLDYLVQTALIGPIQETFRSFPAGMEEQMTLLQDIIRQIAVSITDEEDEWSPEGYDAGQFVREQISRTDQLIRSSARIRDQVLLRIRESTAEVDAQLSAGSFVNHAANLRQYIREQGSRRRKMWLNKTGRQLQEIMILLADQFWYRQSRGFILARKMTGKDSMIRSHVHDLLTLVERVSPRQEVMSRLPFYYRQLFLRRQSFMNEFWTGRERELEKASAALKRYERGHRGSIMVTGERQSGKSFFVHYMVSSRLPGRRLYVVQAPVNSTARIEPFYDALAESTGQKGPGPDSLANLEEGSILFFEDIELWWEKAGGGLQVIDLIKDMTERYSGRFIIVMSCNIHAFSLLAKMRPLEDGFLSVIRLMPLNAEELRDILLNRHRSGGLKLAFEHKRHLAVRTWEYARLFNRYYLYSQGNPGAALRAWMAHITSVEGSTAVTRSPRLPDLDVFDHLPPDWYVSMVLFVLHRRMNIDKLRRTWNSDSRKGDSGSTGDPLEALLADMKRAGILIEAGKGVFELNEWLYPFVAGFLIDKDIL